MKHDDAWIELRRFDDPLEAEITRNFLTEHEIEVATQGNTGGSAVLNRFTTVIDVRLLVRPSQLAAARQTLEAMIVAPDEIGNEPPDGSDRVQPDAPVGPYRSATTARGADDARSVRYRRAVPVVALALPIGGGHFYARHNVAGAMLGLGIVGCFFVGSANNPWLIVGSFVLIAIDVMFGLGAVTRLNAGSVTGAARQAMFGLVAIAVSIGIAAAVNQLPRRPTVSEPTGPARTPYAPRNW